MLFTSKTKLLFSLTSHHLFKRSSYFFVTPSMSYFCTASTSIALKKHLISFNENEYEQIKHNFGLHSINDLKILTEKYKKHTAKLSINEHILFLSTYMDIFAKQEKKIDANQLPLINTLATRIKSLLRETEEEYPLIATLLEALNILELYKDKELWLILGDYVINGRMNYGFKECLKALENSNHIKLVADDDYYNEFYSALENRILEEYPKEIIPLESLLKIVQKYKHLQRTANQQFLDKLEGSFQHHLLEATADLVKRPAEESPSFIEIAYCLSKLDHIDSQTIGYLITIIESKLQQQEGDLLGLDFKSDDFARLVYVFGRSQQPISNTAISSFIKQSVKGNNNYSYHIQHLCYLYEYLPLLDCFEEEYEIEKGLGDKIFNIQRAGFDFSSVENYIKLRGIQEFSNDLRMLPDRVATHLDLLCLQNLKTAKKDEVFNLFEFIENNNLQRKFKGYYEGFLGFFTNNLKYYDFEQWCLVYYFFVKENNYKKDPKLSEDLEVLKGYIYRFYSAADLDHTAFSEKLAITSNFYKILEVIDINELSS